MEAARLIAIQIVKTVGMDVQKVLQIKMQFIYPPSGTLTPLLAPLPPFWHPSMLYCWKVLSTIGMSKRSQ